MHTNRIKKKLLILLVVAGGSIMQTHTQELPDKKEVLHTMIQVNDYFIKKYADYKAPSHTDRIRPSNIWTRGVYYEGLMALYRIYPQEKYYRYMLDWAEF